MFEVTGEASSDRAPQFASEYSVLLLSPPLTMLPNRWPTFSMTVDNSAAVCTDTGIVTPLLEQRLQGCELLLLETNHDKDMLRHGPYPWSLKQRIDSRTGHLSNHQSCEAIDRVGSKVLKAVVGMHLSAENNCPNLVCENLRQTVGNGTQVDAVTRNEMLRIILDGKGVDFESRDLPR